jgi:hypothetical protein
MAEPQASATPPSGKNGGPRDPREPMEAAARTVDRAAETGQRRTEEAARAAEKVVDKSAEASRAAARANSEILRTQMETAQQAMRSTLETGMRGLEGLTQNVSRAFGVASPDANLAEQSARNVQAVSQASTALARGAQDASRAWFDLTQKTVRTNLEALSELAGCRSVQEVVALQSRVVRDNLGQAIESGEAIARASTDAIREAGRAIQQQVQPGA